MACRKEYVSEINEFSGTERHGFVQCCHLLGILLGMFDTSSASLSFCCPRHIRSRFGKGPQKLVDHPSVFCDSSSRKITD